MISLDKKYRYRNGKPAVIESINDDACHVLDRFVVSRTPSNQTIRHYRDGLAYWSTPFQQSDYDLIQVLTKVEKLDRLSVLATEREKIDAEITQLEAELDAEEQP